MPGEYPPLLAGRGGGRNRLLFSNPAKADSRTNMTVRLSYDEATTLAGRQDALARPGRVLVPGGAARRTILCLYERGEKDSYETITLARFRLDWLTDGKDR